MNKYRFHSTVHERRRVEERRLSFESMKDAVCHSDKVIDLNKGKNGGMLRKFFKKKGYQTLVVVAEIRDNECWIVTGYYES